MNGIGIAGAALVLVFAAAPAEAGIRRNGEELNGIRRNGTESGTALAAPRLEGLVLRDGTVLRPVSR